MKGKTDPGADMAELKFEMKGMKERQVRIENDMAEMKDMLRTLVRK